MYSDGSRLDGPSQLLARNGWAFVAFDSAGQMIAAANGVTPRWIDDIPGVEAWALTQAAIRAEPGCEYRVDCEPCVKAVHRGRAWATSGQRPHARVNALMHAALDDTARDAVVWMPAHKKESDVGVARLGNGSYLTQLDVKGNAEADRLAKLAVGEHRVPKWVATKVQEQDALVEATARWIAMATFEANHQTIKPLRDSDATRSAAVTAARFRQNAARQQPERRTTYAVTRRAALGGHVLRLRGATWVCIVCQRRSKLRSTLAPRRCEGSAVQRWDARAQALGGHDQAGAGHARVKSGEVVWCIRCGSYAESAAKGLAKWCRGRLQGDGGKGGLAGQLKSLMAGRHPVTQAALPPPIPESKWNGHGPAGALRAISRQRQAMCEVDSSISWGSGSSAFVGVRGSDRFAALRDRVRAKEAAARSVESLGEVMPVEASTSAERQADAVGTMGAGGIAAIRQRMSGKRPQGLQRDAAAGELGGASKRRKASDE